MQDVCVYILGDETKLAGVKTANITKKVFLPISVRNSVLFLFWFRGGNVDGEYGYNVFNILVEVDDILLERSC